VPAGIALSALDEMLTLSIQGGHLEAMRRLLDAGARIDGDPHSEEIPLGHRRAWHRPTSLTDIADTPHDDEDADRTIRTISKIRSRRRCSAGWRACG
jgi:hypothetical protein